MSQFVIRALAVAAFLAAFLAAFRVIGFLTNGSPY